jgi:hypothetical protein
MFLSCCIEQAHFAKYIEAGVEPGEVEDLYKEVRAGLSDGGCFDCFLLMGSSTPY